MNPSAFFRERMQLYSTKLKGLGVPSPPRSNFFYGPSVNDSDVLMTAIKSGAVFPALMLEYPDGSIDTNGNTGLVETLGFGLSVISRHSAKASVIEVEKVIFDTCKPLLDRSIARLIKESNKGQLVSAEGNFELQIVKAFQGEWMGPFADNCYGYRYQVDLRVFGGDLVYRDQDWEP